MSRSCRLLIAALLLVAAITVFMGWWTLPVSPTTQQFRYGSPHNENYHPGGSECQPAALAKVGDAMVRLREAEDCQKEAEEYRQSSDDLIQQTRAANAAQAQADIASQQLWTGWLQTLGGFLTLAAAVGAAIYAREAAKHTREGNEIVKSAQRAWVTADISCGDIKIANERIYFSYVITCRNIGQTVAENFINVVNFKSCAAIPYGEIKADHENWKKYKIIDRISLMPDEKYISEGDIDYPISELPWGGIEDDPYTNIIINTGTFYSVNGVTGNENLKSTIRVVRLGIAQADKHRRIAIYARYLCNESMKSCVTPVGVDVTT